MYKGILKGFFSITITYCKSFMHKMREKSISSPKLPISVRCQIIRFYSKIFILPIIVSFGYILQIIIFNQNKIND